MKKEIVVDTDQVMNIRLMEASKATGLSVDDMAVNAISNFFKSVGFTNPKASKHSRMSSASV